MNQKKQATKSLLNGPHRFNACMMKAPADLDSAYALQSPEDNKRLYRDWANTYDQDFVQATGFRFPKLIADAYRQMGGNWPCLDVGCGTGAVAEELPRDAIVDGLDISPEMLSVATEKMLYRNLIEANLNNALDIPDASYEGFVSSGTFTHGHVGAEALPELVRILRPGGLAVHSIKADLWISHGFETTFEAMECDGLISKPITATEAIYPSHAAPEGHEQDIGLIVSFRRL